jgi:NADH dehydrogenase (ubiquinone) Fe-S protein 1
MFLRRAVGAVRRGTAGCPIPPHRPFSASASVRAEIEITVDGKKVRVEQGAALIQACELAGVQIPRYGDGGGVADGR